MMRLFFVLACFAVLAAAGCRGKGTDGTSSKDVVAGADQPASEPQIQADKEECVLHLGKGTMPPVRFPHLEHVEDYGVACRTCHHEEGEIQACTRCHKKAAQPGGAKSFMDAAHKSCTGCHKKQGGPTACAQCHAS
jgi:hypothetical protein